MNRLAFLFMLLAVLLFGYSECTPMHPRAVIDDHIAEDADASLITEEEKVTCATINDYCLRELGEKHKELLEFCKANLQYYLCEEKEE